MEKKPKPIWGSTSQLIQDYVDAVEKMSPEEKAEVGKALYKQLLHKPAPEGALKPKA